MHKSSPVFVQNMCALAELSHRQWGRRLFTSVTCTATPSMFHLFTVAGILKKWMLAQHAHPCAATDKRIKLCLSTAQLCFYHNPSNLGLFWGWANTWAKLHNVLFQPLMRNRRDSCSTKHLQFKQKSLSRNAQYQETSELLWKLVFMVCCWQWSRNWIYTA